MIYALLTGVIKQINFMGLGVQIDVCAERMADTQLGIFCLVGALATFCVGYLLAALAKNICRAQSKLFRAMYITIAFLLLDPLYLSVLCGFFGGGDMNGIALLCPEWAAKCLFGVLFLATLSVAALLWGVRLHGSIFAFLGSWALTMLSTQSIGMLAGAWQRIPSRPASLPRSSISPCLSFPVRHCPLRSCRWQCRRSSAFFH